MTCPRAHRFSQRGCNRWFTSNEPVTVQYGFQRKENILRVFFKKVKYFNILLNIHGNRARVCRGVGSQNLMS